MRFFSAAKQEQRANADSLGFRCERERERERSIPFPLAQNIDVALARSVVYISPNNAAFALAMREPFPLLVLVLAAVSQPKATQATEPRTPIMHRMMQTKQSLRSDSFQDPLETEQWYRIVKHNS